MKQEKSISVIFPVLFSALTAGAPLWNHNLWLGRGGLWEYRVALTVDNLGDSRYEGTPIALRIGSAPGEIPLTGDNQGAVGIDAEIMRHA